MKPAVARAPSAEPESLAQRLKKRILHDYFLRLHMSLILTAVVASGVLTSKGLLELGVLSLPFRYPIAVIGSYAVFLSLVRIWIWYVARRQKAAGRALDVFNNDVFNNLGSSRGSGGGSGVSFGGSSGGSGGGGGALFRFGGGDSGGAGASGLWEADAQPSVVPPVSPGASGSSSSSSWLPSMPDIDLDLGDDGWWILLLLGVLVLAIFCCGGYLIWAAPQILPEAACQVVLASTLTRVSKDHHHGWMGGVFKSTIVPFSIVLLLAFGLGFVAHRHCPQAGKLMEALYCPAQ
jgi:hypothetical protein